MKTAWSSDSDDRYATLKALLLLAFLVLLGALEDVGPLS